MTTPIGLEIWLCGTPAELDAAAYALARLGRIEWRSQRHRMWGTDTGRYRVYVRIHVTSATAPPPKLGKDADPAEPPLFDLAA